MCLARWGNSKAPFPSPPLQVTRFIRAIVTLAAGGTTIVINDPSNPNNVPDVTLPDVPVLIPVLAIPTLLALFLHVDFAAKDGDDDGAVLIVVPASSPLRSFEQVQPLLNTLESTVSSLPAIPRFASLSNRSSLSVVYRDRAYWRSSMAGLTSSYLMLLALAEDRQSSGSTVTPRGQTSPGPHLLLSMANGA
jgi:hypothetical protein